MGVVCPERETHRERERERKRETGREEGGVEKQVLPRKFKQIQKSKFCSK
jgi:hypothetical protein